MTEWRYGRPVGRNCKYGTHWGLPGQWLRRGVWGRGEIYHGGKEIGEKEKRVGVRGFRPNKNNLKS